MALIDAALAAKKTFVLGITNAVSLLLVFFSCRCLAGNEFVKRMQRFEW